MADAPPPPPDGSPRPPRLDPVNIGCNLLFGLLLLIPAAALAAGVVVAVASVPLVLVLFPITIAVGALALGVLYLKHRRTRRARPLDGNDAPR